MNRENLRILADYLDALPAETKKFDMTVFATRKDNPWHGFRPANITEAYEECGTVACAAGHGPMAGIDAWSNETWSEYVDRVFVLSEDEFDWCFTSGWTGIDNTPHGAAARIRWLLDKGVPGDFWNQLLGKAPLCYAVSA